MRPIAANRFFIGSSFGGSSIDLLEGATSCVACSWAGSLLIDTEELLQARPENFLMISAATFKRRAMAVGAGDEPIAFQYQHIALGKNGLFPRAARAGEGEGSGWDWHSSHPVTIG